MLINIIILLLLLASSAFFAASELTFFSLSNAKVSAMIKRKLPRAEVIEKLKKNQRRLLITILIGNNLTNIFAASYATIVIESFFPNSVLGITTGVMTLLILTFGEIVPKAYAGNHPRQTAIVAAPLLVVLGWIFYPIILFFEWFSNLLTGKQKIEKISAEEVQALASTSISQGVFSREEGMIMHRVFRFNDIVAEDVMTNLSKVVFVDDNFTLGQVAELVKVNKHTRFPVVHGGQDNIVGIVHAKDLFVALAEKGSDDVIVNHMFPIFSVSTGMPIDELLTLFQKKRSHMAVVKDVRNKVVGIITLEDVLEELVGEIADEHDTENN